MTNAFQRTILSYITTAAICFCAMTAQADVSDEVPCPNLNVSPAPGTFVTSGVVRHFTVRAKSESPRMLIPADDPSAWPVLTCGADTLRLSPVPSDDMSECRLVPVSDIPAGAWTLHIPARCFTIEPTPEEISFMPLADDVLSQLSATGYWHIEGEPWTETPMFTIHDDDTLDGTIPSSGPSPWMRGGYFSTLYPVLESLGLRGCLSMEGWRVGFTDNPPALNDNGRIAKILQDSAGWEIQSHSMTARYQTNSWVVDSIDSPLADKILREANYSGLRSNNTTSVYDLKTGRNWYASPERDRWIAVPTPWIKPYLGDYETRRIVMYNPSFPIDYQWGEWFRIAESLGIHGNAWVTPGPTSSHAVIPLINKVCPNGFESDGQTFYNLPPLRSTVTRLMMEGQAAPGYKGEQTTDNTFNYSHFNFFLRQIDEAREKGAWIVMGLHAYRPCWVNYIPGTLVSEGGTYPDAWVNPMENVDPHKDGSLAPPPELGISDWSEWRPCPGTRLEMLWALLGYARDSGMLNVTSSEAFARMGNRVAEGYYIRGVQVGNDTGRGIKGTRAMYPHYVVGANGEEEYYNYAMSEPLTVEYDVVTDIMTGIDGPDSDSGSDTGSTAGKIRAVSVDGTVREVRSPDELPAGLWIIDGRKHLVR